MDAPVVEGEARAGMTSGYVMWRHVPEYNAHSFTRTRRLSAASQLKDPEGITLALVGRLLAATTGRDDYKPFQQL